MPKKDEKEGKKPKKMLKKKTSCCKLQNTSFSCSPLDRSIRREYYSLRSKHISKRTGGWPPMQCNEASGVSRGGSFSLSFSLANTEVFFFFSFSFFLLFFPSHFDVNVYLKWYMGLWSKLDPLGWELGSELDPFGMRTNVKHLSYVYILTDILALNRIALS